MSWKPVFPLLEGRCEGLVVHAQPLKAVPGRKTEVKDAAWLAARLHQGLLKARCIPAGPHRAVPDLTYSRLRLTEEKAREGKRVQQTLAETKRKLGAVVSDSMGKASRMTRTGLLW